MKVDYKKYTREYQKFLEKFQWSVQGTLTPPFRMSNFAMHNAIERLFRRMSKVHPDYRILCVAERFSNGGYHLHYLCHIPSLTVDETIRFTELKWADTIGVKKRTNNKSRKYSSAALEYFIKSIMEKSTLYELDGNF
jgi:hypothetical protein